MRRFVLFLLLFVSYLTASSQERRIITSDSVSLYVNVKGRGPACLYIHGGPGAGSYWLEKLFGDSLNQHFQMIYLDQRGVGRSTSPKDHNYSMDRMAKDFEEVREALGIKQWLTLGHSFGGILQMGYYEHYPRSTLGMLMINCTLDMGESFGNSWLPKAYEFMGVPNPASVPGDTTPVISQLQNAIGKLNEKGLRWKMAFASPKNEKILDDTYNEIPNWNNGFSSVALSIDDYWNDYRQNTPLVKVPVLFFYGKNDWSIGPEHYKGVHFPEMLTLGSRVGHMPFLENRSDLVKAIKSYKAKYKESLVQNCDCSSELSFIKSYFENNSPAFQKIKSNPKAFKEYSAGVQKLKANAKREKDSDLCIIHLDKYVGLLKDHHSGIGFNLKRAELNTAEQIATFKASEKYLSFKKITIDTSSMLPLLNAKKTADIEGVYSDGRSIVFGIIKNNAIPNKYLGVVLRQNKLLDPGHILMELSGKQNNSYDIIYNTGLLGFNFQKIFKNIVIENGQIPALGFSKTSKTAVTSKSYEFKSLNASTNYLRLSSFDGRLTEELDDWYETIDREIRSKPFLIIDLRNNGGGSERSYLNLLQYAYTKPLKIDPAEVWVSPENIKRYEETGSENNKELIGRMKAAKPFSFIPFSEGGDSTWTLDSSTVFPRKIALLFNRGTASAAEGMITYLMQSNKVITLGENSGGFIGYGNVMTAKTPCEKFTIQSTTTKYTEKSKYEFTGIEPMYKLSKQLDWIKYAETIFDKNNSIFTGLPW